MNRPTNRIFIPIPHAPAARPYVPPRTRAAVPSSADRRALWPTVVDQGDHGGACVTNAGLGGLVSFTRRVLGLPDLGPLARLFSYYNAMVQESQGRGMAFADGIAVRSLLDSLTRQGYCPESLCGYRLKDYHKQPSGAAYREAFRHHIPLTYPEGVPAYSCLTATRDATGQFYDIDAMKACVALGHCFMFALVVTDNLRLQDYALVGPSGPVGAVADGHCVCAVGYDDSRAAFLCRNSWGDWGYQHGHLWVPYDLMRDPRMVFDAYTIDALTG